MDNVRSESFLGNDKVIVGNKFSDLVLETLGKVYIKTGTSSRVLSDVLALLDKTKEDEVKSLTIIVNDPIEMEQMEYPGDGFFIYSTLTTTLYISYDQRYIALIEAAEGADDGYVRRRGDTMTGQLAINTVGPPLVVASSKLVRNFNAQYINGFSDTELAKKRFDEYITGEWTFRGKGISESNWIFKDNVRMYGDLVTSRSISTPDFMSGFGGYGWRMDADTNTLTVDYLVVRKAMRVFELVVNKITATNGSIWISNSSKCSAATAPIILTDSQLRSIGTWTGSSTNKDALLSMLPSDKYYIITDDTGVWSRNLDNYREDGTGGITTMKEEISTAGDINTTPKAFVNYKFIIYINDTNVLINSPLFKGVQTLYDEQLLTSNWESYSGSASEIEYNTFKSSISLYYIYRERTVTKWNDTEPASWEYLNSFDRDFQFFIIPRNTDDYEDYETNGHDSLSLIGIKTFYKYFGLERDMAANVISAANASFYASGKHKEVMPNIWIVDTDDDEYPLFKAGDIIRCQKFDGANIKYYDAIVTSQIGSRRYIVQKATSVFDIYTKIEYNEDGSIKNREDAYNNTQYNKTEEKYDTYTGKKVPVSDSTTSDRLDDIASGDDMVQMGNIQDVQRQNAIYLTSSDDNGPYIDVISGLNRPDYSVLYSTPVYKRKELYDKGGVKHNYYYQREEIKDAPTFVEKVKIEDEVSEITYYCTSYPTRTSEIKQKDGKYRYSGTVNTRARLGRLDGIYNETFGNKQPYGFGLYGENVFLTGEFYLNNGSSVVEFSEENVLLKFKMAGISIHEVRKQAVDTEGNPMVDAEGKPIYEVDEEGNPVYEQAPIFGLDNKPVLNEDGTQKYQNKTEIELKADQMIFKSTNNTTIAVFATDKEGNGYLNVEGLIKARGLNINDNCIIDKDGTITARNAYLSGFIVASSGYLGGTEYKVYENDLVYVKQYYPRMITKVGDSFKSLFLYPKDNNPNSPTFTTLNYGVTIPEGGYIMGYYGGFTVDRSSIKSVPGNYNYGNSDASFAIYSSGDEPWISFSNNLSGREQKSVRLGLNVLPSSTALDCCLSITAQDPYANMTGASINVYGGEACVGLSVKAETYNGHNIGPATAIEAYGDIRVTRGSFYGTYWARNRTSGGHTQGLYPDAPEVSPDLDGIKLIIHSGLIVGYTHD